MSRPDPDDRLQRIQAHFHALIRERAKHIEPPPDLDLPLLKAPLPGRADRAWFPVPGMYGGFAYWIETEGTTARLVTESWCRVAEGSGQRHVITEEGCRMVEEGFV